MENCRLFMNTAMRKIFLTIIVFPFLAACQPQAVPTPVPTTVAAGPSSPLDGNWNAQGQDSNGLKFEINFIVRAEKLAGFSYNFIGTDGIPCYSFQFVNMPPERQIAIQSNRAAASLGSDSLEIVFTNDQSASGRSEIHWHERNPRCNGDYDVTWSAVRQAAPVAQATQSTQPPQSQAPHPFQTLIQILVFGLSNGAVLALNAIGVTLIYSTVRVLNLAHGDVFALTTALVTSLINFIGVQRSWPPLQIAGILLMALCAAMVLGALLSMGVDQFGFRPFRGASQLAPLIATLGISFILYQGSLIWRTFQGSWIPGEHRSVPGLPEVPTDGIPNLLPEINLAAKLGFSNLVIRFSDVFVLFMAIAFVLLAIWFLKKTYTGRAIRALAQNQELAQILGININAAIRNAFAVGGAFAGAAAFIFALYYSRPFGAAGAQSGLIAFAAALLGGIGSPVGALLSGLTMGVFSSLSDYYLSAQWTPFFVLALLVILLAWRPTGLASVEGAETESASTRDSVILTAANSGSRTNRWLVILLIALGAFPILSGWFHWGGQIILRTVEVFILLALGLNLALGLAGLLDFGFAASFGLGAYAGALLSHYDAVVALLVGAGAASLLGWLKGGLAFRLRGDFLAVATLALGLMVRQAAINLHDLTGGAGGFGGFPAPHFLDFSLADPTIKFYLVFVFVVLISLASQRLMRSRTGRAWVASSEDESAAQASGVNVGRERMWALIFSSALAGLAGALYAGTFSYVDPETMSFQTTSLILTMVILGGAGNVPGLLIGAAAIVLYDKVFVTKVADLVALIWPHNLSIGNIGSAPDIRGASFFNFGIALYLTVLLRARRRKERRE